MNDAHSFFKVTNVSKIYRDGKVNALTDVSCTIDEGEFFYVRGPSGSGKSTLLHLLGGLDYPTHGTITLNGQPLDRLLRQKHFRLTTFGFVFQLFYLWPTLNAAENIYLPLMDLPLRRREKALRVQNLIKTVGLAHRERSQVRELSVGERQRVAVARALVTQPKILLADEPTGSLDSENAAAIVRLFKKVNIEHRITIIMITHEALSEHVWDRGIELFDGRLKENLTSAHRGA